MNKERIDSPTIFQKWLQDVRGHGGLYYLETSMMEDDLRKALFSEKGQRMIRLTCCSGQPFMESFLIALAHYINTPQVNKWVDILISGTDVNKHTIYQAFLYDCNLHFRNHSISVILFYVVGQINTFCKDDVLLLEQALQECNFSIIQIVAHSISNNQITNLKTMKNVERLNNVHFSYKHLDRHNDQIMKIEKGFVNAGIHYSIDKHLAVGDNIRKYEEEIGRSKLVIVIISDEYLRSPQCMFEITKIVKNGNFDNRVVCIAELNEYTRNGDGLKKIKTYWAEKKNDKAEQIKNEPGGSAYVLRELADINDFLKYLDDIWTYLTDVLTESMDELSKSDGEKLVEIVRKELTKRTERVDVSGMSAVSGSTANTFGPSPSQSIQYGEKSIYVQNNEGTININ